MSGLWNEFVVRPLDAVAEGLSALEDGLSAGDTLDAMASRFAQGLAAPPRLPAGEPSTDAAMDDLTADDVTIISMVERSLRNGLDLLAWFESTRAQEGFDEVFTLERTFNRPGASYGFLGRATLPAFEDLPVMGNVQRMFYDAARVPPDLQPRAVDWMQQQMREFVLRYFMRVSAFRAPETFAADEEHAGAPRLLQSLSWCPRSSYEPRGFGFSQLYYKRRDGRIGKFSDEEATAIVDLRELGVTYEWIVVKVRIFDFDLRFRPLGDEGPEVVLGLNEESLLVISPDFIVDETSPASETVGQYGLGYAFIRNPGEGLVAYGPGQFDVAIELITFSVDRSGDAFVEMIFAANRPTEIVNLVLDPVDWGFRIADTLLFGVPSQVFAPVKAALAAFPLRFGQFDPVYAYIDLANALTLGQAGGRLCITRDQLDKRFLVQHFMQHYQVIVGSLLTWRQVPDWLDAASLPDWVVDGISV
jgi:hypothetical protein